MAEHHEGDLRTVGNVLQIFTNDAWFDFRVISDYEQGRADMLEEVIKYLENNLEFAMDWSDIFIDRFKKAMRQQEGEQ